MGKKRAKTAKGTEAKKSDKRYATMWDTDETGHTAGDWYVGNIDHEKHRAYVYAEREYPNSVCVAEVRTESILRFELEHNTNLITASPKLLEACESVLEDLEISEDGKTIGETSVKLLRAAIAKAKGENRE